MPKPTEICVVTAGGQKYDIWETVECTHSVDDVIDHAMLTVAENSTGAKKISDLKLKPGDRASVTLAGQKVLDGLVYLRQAAFDGPSHAVQIGIVSLSQAVTVSTVKAKPGQYINQTLQQIGSAVFGEEGISLTLKSDASEPFPRVSVHVGESKFAFIERLSRMRNIHLVDDGSNGIVGFRGPMGFAGSVLQEGRNIKRARLLLKINEYTEDIDIFGQDAGNDTSGANSNVKGSAKANGPPIGRYTGLIAEEMGSKLAMQLRSNHEADWKNYSEVDGDVTTQGWLDDQGSLWWNSREKVIAVISPMLIPQDQMAFMIKGIVHRQNSTDGTTTDILLCRADGLGAGGENL
jgi:prophage tail gpP-like protein